MRATEHQVFLFGHLLGKALCSPFQLVMKLSCDNGLEPTNVHVGDFPELPTPERDTLLKNNTNQTEELVYNLRIVVQSITNTGILRIHSQPSFLSMHQQKTGGSHMVYTDFQLRYYKSGTCRKRIYPS